MTIAPEPEALAIVAFAIECGGQALVPCQRGSSRMPGLPGCRDAGEAASTWSHLAPNSCPTRRHRPDIRESATAGISWRGEPIPAQPTD